MTAKPTSTTSARGGRLLGHADRSGRGSWRSSRARHELRGRTELEIEMEEEIIDAVPSIEMVRMVNSGTEATMSALSLARGGRGATAS